MRCSDVRRMPAVVGRLESRGGPDAHVVHAAVGMVARARRGVGNTCWELHLEGWRRACAGSEALLTCSHRVLAEPTRPPAGPDTNAPVPIRHLPCTPATRSAHSRSLPQLLRQYPPRKPPTPASTGPHAACPTCSASEASARTAPSVKLSATPSVASSSWGSGRGAKEGLTVERRSQ